MTRKDSRVLNVDSGPRRSFPGDNMDQSESSKDALSGQSGFFRLTPRRLLAAGLAAAFAALIFSTGYFYLSYRSVTDPGRDRAEAESYVSRIRKFMVLPEGEIPSLATVKDVEKLKEQSFFAKAQNGDKVLIYSQAQRALLYRPDEDKVVEVMALSRSSVSNTTEAASEAAPESIPAPEPPSEAEKIPENIRVAVYNGTGESGLAGRIKEKIKGMAGIEVVSTGNAVGNYGQTLVIDLSGKESVQAQQLIEEVGGEMGVLPDSELRPEAEILIIGGKDFKN